MLKLGRVRLAAAVLAALLLILTSASCGGSISEEEMLGIFAEKYGSSLAVNEYIYGRGPDVDEYEALSGVTVLYVPVSETALYRTREALVSAVRDVYTADLIEDSIMPKLFEGFEGEDDISPRYSEKDGVLTKNVCDVGYELEGRVDVGSAEIEKLTSSTARIKAQYTSASGERSSVTFLMVLESGGWRFDGPTY